MPSSPHPPRRRGSSGALCGGSFLKTTGSRPSPGTRTTSCPLPERAPPPSVSRALHAIHLPPVLRTEGGKRAVRCLHLLGRGRWIARGAGETEGDGAAWLTTVSVSSDDRVWLSGQRARRLPGRGTLTGSGFRLGGWGRCLRRRGLRRRPAVSSARRAASCGVGRRLRR
jgi:hypothetical protein